MPYKTTWLANGIIWTYSGVLTGNELLNSNFEIFGDERFDDIRYQIVDLSAVEKVEVTENHMRKIAHLDMAAARTNPRIKVAVVSTTSIASDLRVFNTKNTPAVNRRGSHRRSPRSPKRKHG